MSSTNTFIQAPNYTLACYDFENNSNDTGPNKYHLSLVGSPAYTSDYIANGAYSYKQDSTTMQTNYFSGPAAVNSGLSNTKDYIVDFWFYPTGTAFGQGNGIFSATASGGAFNLAPFSELGSLVATINGVLFWNVFFYGSNMHIGSWNHIHMICTSTSGSSIEMLCNNVSLGKFYSGYVTALSQTYTTNNLGSVTGFKIGGEAPSRTFVRYVDKFRISLTNDINLLQ
jgi:hypothetical protein